MPSLASTLRHGLPLFDRGLQYKLHESKTGDFGHEMDVYCCEDSATSLVCIDSFVSANHPSNSNSLWYQSMHIVNVNSTVIFLFKTI
jgi:hypothetical protein